MERKIKESSIFDKFIDKRKTLITNRNFLQSTYIPDQLPHRQNKIDEIVEIISPSLSRNKPSNILIIGKTGTGKTAVLNYIGKEMAKADPNEEKCSYIYINCEVVTSSYGILFNISNLIIKENSKRIPFTGWSLDKVYQELRNYIDEKNKVFIIVLDEIDKSFKENGDDIFYFLTTINEELKNSMVSLIGISNNTKFTELLSTKIKSRLGEEKIIFTPYTPQQLTDILNERAKIAFEPGILSSDVVPLCAAISAQNSGDARKALDLLRVAADIAERNGDSSISEAHVNYARNKIEMDTVVEVVKTLTIQSKIVLMSIYKNMENDNQNMTTGDVFTTYKEICPYVGYQILSQRTVANLIAELDMLGLIHAKVKSFGRNGRTKEINLNINKDVIDIFVEDDIFKNLENYKPSKQMTLM